MPPPRIGHIAVLIANGVIVFIGGIDVSTGGAPTAVSMNNFTLYDTKADTWDLMTIVGGPAVDTRIGHTAVYTANGQIIVYGGITSSSFVTPNPELVVLDTTTKRFKWIIPQVTSEIAVNSLTQHQADLIGDYMVVTFGNITNNSGPPRKASNSIQILNIVDYKWIKSFPGLSPNSKTSPTASPSTPSTSTSSTSDSGLGSTTILAIVVSVGFALIIAASIGIFLLHRRNRQKRNAQELSSFNDASSSTHSTQMTSSPHLPPPHPHPHPPPHPSSQGQINNNDNFMRSISTTTSPSLISSPNSQSPSNLNSVFSLLNSNNNLNNRNNISPLSMLYIDPTNPASQTLPMITTPPSTTPTTATNSTYGNDINNNNNNFGSFGVTPQIHSPSDLIQQQQLQLLQLQLLQQQQQSQQFQPLQQQLLQQQLLQQLMLVNQSLSPTSNLQQVSNTMDPNLQSGLERSAPDLNNIPINKTCTNISTTNQVIHNDNGNGGDNGNDDGGGDDDGDDDDGDDNSNGNDGNDDNDPLSPGSVINIHSSIQQSMK